MDFESKESRCKNWFCLKTLEMVDIREIRRFKKGLFFIDSKVPRVKGKEDNEFELVSPSNRLRMYYSHEGYFMCGYGSDICTIIYNGTSYFDYNLKLNNNGEVLYPATLTVPPGCYNVFIDLFQMSGHFIDCEDELNYLSVLYKCDSMVIDGKVYYEGKHNIKASLGNYLGTGVDHGLYIHKSRFRSPYPWTNSVPVLCPCTKILCNYNIYLVTLSPQATVNCAVLTDWKINNGELFDKPLNWCYDYRGNLNFVFTFKREIRHLGQEVDSLMFIILYNIIKNRSGKMEFDNVPVVEYDKLKILTHVAKEFFK